MDTIDMREAEPMGGSGVYGLDHVQIAIPPGGEADARVFYRLLGMTELAKPTSLAERGGCWFVGGSAVLHCGVEAGFRPARKAHPAFLVGDLATIRGRLEAAGYACEGDVSLPNIERLHVNDPHGNRIELIERARTEGLS